MEMDDFDNPGMIDVEKAINTWNTAEGSEGEILCRLSCAPEDMAGGEADISQVE